MDSDASYPEVPAALMAGRAASVQGQMHRHRVNVDARDRFPQAVEDFFRFPIGRTSGGDKMGDRFGYEGAGAAGRVQHPLVQRVVHQFPDHDRASQAGV